MCTNMGSGGASKTASSPLLKGEPETISTRFKKSTRYFDDEALDARFDASTGTLRLDYAGNSNYKYESGSYKDVDFTVQNGLINGRPVNLDLNSKAIKRIDDKTTKSLSDKTIETLQSSGFAYSSKTGMWEKGYKGYYTEGKTLRVDSALPDNFKQYSTIKTRYGAINTRILKDAGYRWNGEAWVKK